MVQYFAHWIHPLAEKFLCHIQTDNSDADIWSGILSCQQALSIREGTAIHELVMINLEEIGIHTPHRHRQNLLAVLHPQI